MNTDLPVVPKLNRLDELDPTHLVWGDKECPQSTQGCECSNLFRYQEDPFDFFEEVKGG